MVQAPPSSSSPGVDVAQLLEADREHLIHPLYHPADHTKPLIVVRGEGAEIVDVNGKRYFDALSGLWNVHVGHGRAELAKVAAEQMGTLAFNNNYVGFVNVPAARLAEKLIDLAYPNLNAVYFTTSGADLWNQWSELCCACGLCTLYACPEDLYPKEACDQGKHDNRAAGLKFVLLMTVILAPASLLYVKARSEHGRRLFSPAEVGLFVLIAAGGVIGAVGLWTGRISL